MEMIIDSNSFQQNLKFKIFAVYIYLVYTKTVDSVFRAL